MLAHSVVEPFEVQNGSVAQMKDEVRSMDKAFNDFIVFFPDAYAESKVNQNRRELDEVENVLDRVKSSLERMDQKLKAETGLRKRQSDIVTEEEMLIEAVVDDLGHRLGSVSSGGASEQLKVDKVKIYRYNIVKMLYYLAGTGLAARVIYGLLQ